VFARVDLVLFFTSRQKLHRLEINRCWFHDKFTLLNMFEGYVASNHIFKYLNTNCVKHKTIVLQ